ncbi:unnamed protein product [Ilex paraguariensis]|uniref:Uncharacterized protein n=1 Tax=Ilex paraguariensis TaxID=185542 RepID=A0ABC8TN62_9AQUA
MVGHNPIAVAKTVLEVADVAWTAVECCHHHRHHCNTHEKHQVDGDFNDTTSLSKGEEFEALRSENQQLRNLLEQNLKLLQNLSESPCLLEDCPPDLHNRLVATVDSTSFLSQLKYLHEKSVDGTGYKFPFKDASGTNLQFDESLINVGLEEASWWVWVTDEMFPSNVEEWSGIDNENYVVIDEEHVVDGLSNFMARCMLSNPKAQSMTPEELQKTLTKALGGMNKLDKMLHFWYAGLMLYSLSTWGLALAGLYQGRAVLKLAAMGVHTTSKVVLKAL